MLLASFVPQNPETKYNAAIADMRLPHDTLESVLVPLDGLGLVDAVGGSDAGLAASPLGDALTGAGPGIIVSTFPHHLWIATLVTHMQQ